MVTTYLSTVSASTWAGYVGSHPGDVDNANGSNRLNNTVHFESTPYHGLQFGALYSLGGVSGNFLQQAAISHGASYKDGPLLIAAAYENIHNPGISLFDGTLPTSGVKYVSPATNPIFSGYQSATNLAVYGGGIRYTLGKLSLGAVFTGSEYKNVVMTSATPLGGSHLFQNVEGNLSYQATSIKIHQSRYLNNVVEQDHQAIKRRTRFMLGFKTFRCARILLAGIELMHMIAKGQMQCVRVTYPSVAEQFYDPAI
jgi:predicted porin